MKSWVLGGAAAAAMLVTTDAATSTPQCKRASSTGDPHYNPFVGKRYTMMGKGEFNLATIPTSSLKVNNCQDDTRFDRATGDAITDGATITYNKHVAIRYVAVQTRIHQPRLILAS